MKRLLLVACLVASNHLQGALWHGKSLSELAVINTPVVDLVIQLPYPPHFGACPIDPTDPNCPRAHQALKHEVVRIMGKKGNYTRICCENVIYGIDKNGQPLNSFWIPHDRLVQLQDLSQREIDALPPPLGTMHNTVVLILPWKGYSLGTRFVREAARDTTGTYCVKVLDHDHQTARLIYLPRSRARIEAPVTTTEAQRLFVSLAHKLVDDAAAQPESVIPYIWGGSSYITLYRDNNFFIRNNRWERPGPHRPYSGYDCSELVLRLAQTSGIPYVCKLTSLMERMLPELREHEAVEPGQLLWFPGHVMIIVENDQIIEARGYGGGYGRVHRIPLAELFEGITTYAQLRDVIRTKRPVNLLKRDGTVMTVIKQLKIFKLR